MDSIETKTLFFRMDFLWNSPILPLLITAKIHGIKSKGQRRKIEKSEYQRWWLQKTHKENELKCSLKAWEDARYYHIITTWTMFIEHEWTIIWTNIKYFLSTNWTLIINIWFCEPVFKFSKKQLVYKEAIENRPTHSK